jgi:hypothetical protein
VALTVGLASLALAQFTVSPKDVLQLRAGERTLSLRVALNATSGEGFELRRTREGWSGSLAGQPVVLELADEGVIAGAWGRESVRLVASPRASQPGLSVEGVLSGAPVELRLAPTGLSGEVGGCNYSLTLAGNTYVGWRTCEPTRGPPVAVELRLPETLLSLSTEEQAALLSLLLSAEAFSPASLPGERSGQGGAGTPSP